MLSYILLHGLCMRMLHVTASYCRTASHSSPQAHLIHASRTGRAYAVQFSVKYFSLSNVEVTVLRSSPTSFVSVIILRLALNFILVLILILVRILICVLTLIACFDATDCLCLCLVENVNAPPRDIDVSVVML